MSSSRYEDGILIVDVGDSIGDRPFIANIFIQNALSRNERLVLNLHRSVDLAWMFAAFDGVFERYGLTYVYNTICFECALSVSVEFRHIMHLCVEYWQRTRRAAAWERAA